MKEADMLSRLIAVMALILAIGGSSYAGEGPPRDLEERARTSRVFLDAASKAAAETKSKEAAAIVRLAENSYAEALAHMSAGEYQLAGEDLAEARTRAMHAIILVKGEGGPPLKAVVMKETVALMADREQARKQAQIRKGMDEAEVFIKTAERLLRDRPDKNASEKLREARDAFDGAKEMLSKEDYDGAHAGVTKAYRLATASVKTIKRSQGEILTFPKASSYADGKEALAHELKKNDAYAFFASSVIDKGQSGPSKQLSEALAYREDALEAIENGGEARAIEALKTSTELIIRALKSDGR